MPFEVPKLPALKTQPQARDLLLSVTRENRAPSYLFAGPPGAGKATHALSLVRTLFCPEGPDCRGCATCRQVAKHSHPDLIWVDRDYIRRSQESGKERKTLAMNVDVSRAIGEQLSRAPLTAPLKFAVIPHVDQMNVDAQNIILKTLEEPPVRAMILLTAERPSCLLPTVQSRCRLVRFLPISPSALQEALTVSHGLGEKEAQEAARWSGGDFQEALRYHDPGWQAFRDRVVSDLDKAVSGSTRDWLEVSLEFEKFKWEFDDEEDLSDAQLRRRSVEAVLKITLILWARRLQGVLPVPGPLQRLDPGQVTAALSRHLEVLEANLPPRMVLDHLILTLREGLRTGEVETRSFFDLAVQ